MDEKEMLKKIRAELETHAPNGVDALIEKARAGKDSEETVRIIHEKHRIRGSLIKAACAVLVLTGSFSAVYPAGNHNSFDDGNTNTEVTTTRNFTADNVTVTQVTKVSETNYISNTSLLVTEGTTAPAVTVSETKKDEKRNEEELITDITGTSEIIHTVYTVSETEPTSVSENITSAAETLPAVTQKSAVSSETAAVTETTSVTVNTEPVVSSVQTQTEITETSEVTTVTDITEEITAEVTTAFVFEEEKAKAEFFINPLWDGETGENKITEIPGVENTYRIKNPDKYIIKITYGEYTENMSLIRALNLRIVTIDDLVNSGFPYEEKISND